MPTPFASLQKAKAVRSWQRMAETYRSRAEVKRRLGYEDHAVLLEEMAKKATAKVQRLRSIGTDEFQNNSLGVLAE